MYRMLFGLASIAVLTADNRILFSITHQTSFQANRMDGNKHFPVVHEDSPLLAGVEDTFGATRNSDDEENNPDVEKLPADENDETVSLVDVPAMVEAVEEAVEAVVGAVADEVHDVAESVFEEFQDANENDFHYLEFGLTRNFSMLPGDVVHVATGEGPLSVLGDDLSVITMETHKMEIAGTPLTAYLLLASAVISLSAIGPLLEVQADATSTMKIIWRMLGTSILLFPFACHDLYTKDIPILTSPQLFTFLLGTTCYVTMTLAFVISLDYTAVGNAVILANSLALILLAGKLFVGDPVTLMEGTGALLAFGGAALCSKDAGESREASNALFGDALAILSAIGGVGYLIFAKTARTHMPMYLFMFLTMFVGAFLGWFFQVFVLGEQSSFDMNYYHGIWGFLNVEADRLPLELVTVVICNLCGTMGYVVYPRNAFALLWKVLTLLLSTVMFGRCSTLTIWLFHQLRFASLSWPNSLLVLLELEDCRA